MRREQVTTPADQPLIHAKSLRKTYQIGDQVVHALDGLDLDIARNEYVALMGPSGSGKSTLMNMLLSLIHI